MLTQRPPLGCNHVSVLEREETWDPRQKGRPASRRKLARHESDLGEINTLAGNRNSIRTREALMTNSKAFGKAPIEAWRGGGGTGSMYHVTEQCSAVSVVLIVKGIEHAVKEDYWK